MSAESYLSSVVEVSIGVAGFAGIIAAIRQRSVTRWPRDHRIFLEMLLVASVSGIVFALLPAILAEAGWSDLSIWRFGSFAIFGWQLFLVVFRTRQFRAIGDSRRPPALLLTWIAGIWLLQLANVVMAEAWAYLLGVLGLVGNGLYFFVHLLFDDVVEDAPEDES